MRMKVAVLAACMILAGARAQAQMPDGSASRAAMQRLSFMVGRWRGDSWMQRGPGQRDTPAMTETVELKVEGTVLLIEGIGVVPAAGGGEPRRVGVVGRIHRHREREHADVEPRRSGWPDPQYGPHRERRVERGRRVFPGRRDVDADHGDTTAPRVVKRYSLRRVVAGSTRAARHAGTQHAMSATPASSVMTPA